MKRLFAITLAAIALAVSGCSQGGVPTGVVPDFQLVDENPNSSTYTQSVSPRDYLQQVSGWYFIHAT